MTSPGPAPSPPPPQPPQPGPAGPSPSPSGPGRCTCTNLPARVRGYGELERRTAIREDLGAVAAELNAVWPSMRGVGTLSCWPGRAVCCEQTGHRDARPRPSGWVVCFECMTVLYRAAAPDVDRVLAAMEATPV